MKQVRRVYGGECYLNYAYLNYTHKWRDRYAIKQSLGHHSDNTATMWNKARQICEVLSRDA